MADVDLTALTDAGAFVSHEHQEHLASAVGVADAVPDPAAGLLRFTDRSGARREVRAHFIGTVSPEDGTWLWSWENINGFPQDFVRTSERVRALGERYGIAELTTATVPVGLRSPLGLIAAVKALTGITAHTTVATGNGGTEAWLLLDDPSLALPEPTVARAVGVITSALADGTAEDHRRALRAWAEQRGATFEDVAPDVARLGLGDGALQVRFDAGDRISGVGRRLTGAPTPQPGPPPVPAAPPEAPEPVVPAPATELPVEEPAPAVEVAPTARRGWRDRVRDLLG